MTTSARDALGLLFILIIVGVVWSLSGRGIGNIDLSSFGKGPRLSPGKSSQTPSNSQSLFGNKETTIETEKISQVQQLEKQIYISVQAAQNTDPQKEYITIRNGGSEELNLSNLKLKNKNNEESSFGTDENGNSIILRPGEEALVLTGKSTKGANFKINKCSGYFNQFHNFTPQISPRCPNISELPSANNLDDDCVLYLPQIGSCQTPTSLPTNLGSNCQQFIQQHANYQGCVLDFKKDKDFDPPTGGREWRIFLNRGTEFWAKRNETIKLIDLAGKVVVEANY